MITCPKIRSLLLVATTVTAAVIPSTSADAAPPQRPLANDDPVTIRLNVQPGHLLRYNFNATGQTAWAPMQKNTNWGQMATDFTYVLRAKTLRPDGSCTFELLGEQLHSTGETDKGKIDVKLDRQKVKIKPRGGLGIKSKKSPLENAMTVTLGPQSEYRFGTGLGPIAIYMLPHIDRHFWTFLTIAPADPVAPGDQWEKEFNLPLPGAAGEPLQVEVTWSVSGRKRSGNTDVLAISLAAEIDLVDTNLLMKNGDNLHIAKGKFVASGKALWDVRHGILRSATGKQQYLLSADRPTRRELRSQSTASMRLLDERIPPMQP